MTDCLGQYVARVRPADSGYGWIAWVEYEEPVREGGLPPIRITNGSVYGDPWRPTRRMAERAARRLVGKRRVREARAQHPGYPVA